MINLIMDKKTWYIAIILILGLVYWFIARPYFAGNSGTTNPKIESSSLTQSSKEYAFMGMEAWAGFECSSLASKVGDSKEAERLFIFGHEQGQKFLGALKAKKINQEDISQEVPIGMVMLLQGPSDEFILGRVFENAQENALDEVFTTNNNFNPEDLQKSIAENKFRDNNCQLIGK